MCLCVGAGGRGEKGRDVDTQFSAKKILLFSNTPCKNLHQVARASGDKSKDFTGSQRVLLLNCCLTLL